MESLIKKNILKNLRPGKGVKVSVYMLHENDNIAIFIKTQYDNVRKNLKGTFQEWSSTGKTDYFHFQCIRAGIPSEHSYRKVNCESYISYTINRSYAGYIAVIERCFDTHSGHDPDDVTDRHSFPICNELRSEIVRWLKLGIGCDQILLLAHSWATDHGHLDVNDRTFYVTPEDIQNIRKSMLASSRLSPDDTESVHKLLTERENENVLFYQPYRKEEQELIVVLQTPVMKKALDLYGKNTVFLDATHCVNQYSFPLYTVMVRDSFCNGHPVAYIITSDDSQDSLQIALQVMREKSSFSPKSFMVDKDIKEINALQTVFPGAKVLLCWFHVLQAVNRWLMRKESGISGPDHVEARNEVIRMMTDLKQHTKESSFLEDFANHIDHLKDKPKVVEYLEKNWKPVGRMWANFGRNFFHEDSDTNNLTERFFLRIKYQFLAGKRNRRLDDLITVLLSKVDSYFAAMSSLKSSGRIKITKQSSVKEARQAADRLLTKGFQSKLIAIPGQFQQYRVPSEFTDGIFYDVCLAECNCSCPHGQKGMYCKHLQLITLLGDSPDPNFASLIDQVNSHSDVLRRNEYYTIHNSELGDLSVKSPLTNEESFVSLTSNTCTCRANSYYENCPCLVLCRSLNTVKQSPISTASEDMPTVDSVQQTEQSLILTNKQKALQLLEGITSDIRSSDDVSDKFVTDVVNLQQTLIKEHSRFEKKCLKRKIQPLNPKRKAKRHIPQVEKSASPNKLPPALHHEYSTAEHKPTHSKTPIGKMKRMYKTSRRSSLKDQLKTSNTTMKTVKLFELIVSDNGRKHMEKIRETHKLPDDQKLKSVFLYECMTSLRLQCGSLFQMVSDEEVMKDVEQFFFHV